ncbi:MAG: IPT/TIG domain-containing protein, partial [Solirubrobacterales bacterium]
MPAGITRPIQIALALGFLCLLAAFPTVARADVQTIDFDTAPPALGSPVDRVGDVSFPLNLGFRPYRTEVGLRAHSGTTVADLGRCSEEVEARGGDPISCEFFQALTTGVLARTASSVTLFAGRFGPATPFDAPVQATLTAFSAAGAQLATTGPVAIGANGFNTRLSVSSAAGNIARFTVKATSGPNAEAEAGDLGIDDVTVNFADGGAPDFTVSAPDQVLALVQGQSVEVPVQINRLNGSTGPVALSVTGLPNGVSAAPVTIPRNQSAATIVLNAAPDVPETNFLPAEATIVATPEDANVAPAPRTARLLVRVAKDFELSAGGFSEKQLGRNRSVEVEYADCTTVEVPVKIRRDIAMTQEITLSLRGSSNAIPPVNPATGLPPGVSAEILPNPIVSPSGGLTAERTLRFRVNSPKADFSAALIIIEGRVGSDPAAPPHSVRVELDRAKPTATVPDNRPGFKYLTPRYGGQGTTIRIHGNGFCQGTTVDVGNQYAPVPATLVDEHTIEVNVPPKATDGKLLIRPPAPLPPYRAQDPALFFDSFRNVNGFQFENYPYHSISLGELVKAFGADDLFIKVNPCWPFGSCPVPTGLLSPMAAIDWSVFNIVVRSLETTGHCFGMSLAARQFITGKEWVSNFNRPGGAAAKSVYELGYPSGPGVELNHFLDALHLRQFSAEGIDAWFNRPESLSAQLKTIEKEFRGHRPT